MGTVCYVVRLGRKDGKDTGGNIIAVYAEEGGARELCRDLNCDRQRFWGKDDPLHMHYTCYGVRDRCDGIEADYLGTIHADY